jgi:hypothetical protein
MTKGLWELRLDSNKATTIPQHRAASGQLIRALQNNEQKIILLKETSMRFAHTMIKVQAPQKDLVGRQNESYFRNRRNRRKCHKSVISREFYPFMARSAHPSGRPAERLIIP